MHTPTLETPMFKGFIVPKAKKLQICIRAAALHVCVCGDNQNHWQPEYHSRVSPRQSCTRMANNAISSQWFVFGFLCAVTISSEACLRRHVEFLKWATVAVVGSRGLAWDCWHWMEQDALGDEVSLKLPSQFETKTYPTLARHVRKQEVELEPT